VCTNLSIPYVSQKMTVSITNPRSEDWITRNVLYMLLGLDTEIFTTHPSVVITVKSVNFSCMHISPLCLRNVLKRFAVWGTRLNQVRNVSARSVFGSRFLGIEKERLLTPIETQIKKLLKVESLILSQVLVFCRKVLTEVDEFLRFSAVVSVGDMEVLETNPTSSLDDSGSIRNRYFKYAEEQRIELITGDCELPKHLEYLKKDFCLLLSSTSEKPELIGVLGTHVGGGGLGTAMVKYFEEITGYKEIVKLISRICFFTQVDFTDDFIEDIATGADWIGSETAAKGFTRAIERCPALKGFTKESLKRFSIEMDEESIDVFDRVRICIDCDGLIGIMIGQKTLEVIQQISRSCLKMRAALWGLNQTWQKLARCGTKECQNALIIRGKLAVNLQKIIYKLNLFVASTECLAHSGGVQNLCDSFKQRIAETSENVLHLVNNRLLHMSKTFVEACRYPNDINKDLLERIAANVDN
jgi:hypothetical protein